MTDFTEIQHYGWVYDVIVVIVSLGTILFLLRFAQKKIYTLFAVPVIVVLVYFMFVRLETRIDATGIHYRMFPAEFSERTITWDEVSSVKVKNYVIYNRLSSYRYNSYSLNDSHGLYIYLMDGTKVIIGTKKPVEMEETLKQVRSNWN